MRTINDRELINQIEQFDSTFGLNVSTILKSHSPFISNETTLNFKENLSVEVMHQINALVGAFAFLSWSHRDKYYDLQNIEDVLNRYSFMYGSKNEFLSLILNRFRESTSLSSFLYSSFIVNNLLELERLFSLITFQVLVLDQIQQYHIFFASLNKEPKIVESLQAEILKRNEDLNLFYRDSEHQLKSLVAITMDKIPQISMH